MSARNYAIKILDEVVFKRLSIKESFARHLPKVASKDQAFIKALCMGATRFYYRLDAIALALPSKGFKPKDRDLHLLLVLALYELKCMHTPQHATVNAWVTLLAKERKKVWARGLINACLRRYLRETETIESQLVNSEVVRYAHPQWFIQRLKAAYPDGYQDILEANNQHPPMSLRVNRCKNSRKQYLELLSEQGIEAHVCQHSADAIILEQPLAVEKCPGFSEGRVSVQDQAAQLAATLLAVESTHRVLDACAAPGGKTCHLLELAQAPLDLLAIDAEPRRLKKIEENLTRLNLSAQLQSQDATTPSSWWDGRPFDRILLDAPCSATGVIRRQPDIKIIRQAEDVDTIVKLQTQLLEALWPLLAQGGRLLYATCSVLPEENSGQIAAFVAQHSDAKPIKIDAGWGNERDCGRQILPGQDTMDGFYYCILEKI